jgi:glycosyltransferase involved in cell wall biosynthesis
MGGQGQLVILNPEEEHLSSVKDLISEGKIIVLHKISDRELAILYTSAHCSLMFSSYEGFGLPVLESLACGAQVICARNSSLVEAGGEIVDYVDDMDASVIAGRMLRYDSITKVNILDESTIENHLQSFSWERCARKYIEFYNMLFNSSNYK